MHELRPKLKTQENLFKLSGLGALLPRDLHWLEQFNARQGIANSTGKLLVLSETTEKLYLSTLAIFI